MENRDVVMLKRMSELDKLTIEDIKPDIRNWNVLGQKGFKLGIVSDLWIDVEEMSIRYSEIITELDQRILIPIGMIAINKKEQFVNTVDIQKDDLPNIPVFEGDRISREYETNIRRSFLPGGSLSGNEGDFYNHNIFDERSLFGARSTRKKAKKGYLESINQRNLKR